MHIVYILSSVSNPAKCYIGYTKDMKTRLAYHNAAKSGYTKRYAPWQIETYAAFRDELTARRFERYLKEGSGQAFLKRHLLPQNQPK